MPCVRAEVLSCCIKSGHTWVKLYLAKRWQGGLMEVFWMKLPWNLWILKGTFSFRSLSYCITLDLLAVRYWMAIHLALLSYLFFYSTLSCMSFLIEFFIFAVSGCSSAFHYYHAFGRSFCHTSHIASVLLDLSWCFPCCSACSSSILAFSIPCRLECLIQQRT